MNYKRMYPLLIILSCAIIGGCVSEKSSPDKTFTFTYSTDQKTHLTQFELDQNIEKCERGDKNACLKVGLYYENSEDIQMSEKYFKAGCWLRCPLNCSKLASVYKRNKRIEEALSLFIRICEDGHSPSCSSAGNIYAYYFNDNKRAHYFYELGCDTDPFFPPACFNLAVSLFENNKVSEIQKILVLYEKACRADFAPACFNLGLLYLKGNLIQQSGRKGRRLIKKSCDLGLSSACDIL